MNLSKDGLDKIAQYEGYHERLPDGSCKAYQKTYNGKKDKWTNGFGCTEGVYEGLIWTRAEADEAFEKELSKFESAVTRLVTVELNQNQFDALVSFAYNVGLGAGKIPGFSNSTLLRKLNKGDYTGAADQFQYWNHVNGKPVDSLTQRRASEKNLFLKPVAPEPRPSMPQTVSKAPEPPSRKTVAAAVAAGGTAVAQVLPADPLGTAENVLTTGSRVRSVAQQGHDLSGWALSLPHWPIIAGAVALAGGLYWVLCHWLPSKQGTPS
jgi:lysozyme